MNETGSGKRGLNLLLVEDDEDTRAVLHDLLSEQGLTVCACGTGEEALALLHVHHFDAMVTDQVMPGITGLDLVRRARDIDASLYCVVLSGYPAPKEGDVAWIKKTPLHRSAGREAAEARAERSSPSTDRLTHSRYASSWAREDPDRALVRKARLPSSTTLGTGRATATAGTRRACTGRR